MEEERLIKEEIERLTEAIANCQKRLSELQQACDHQFVETPLARHCVKCLLSESLYY